MKYINDQIFSIDKSRYYIKDGNDKGRIFCKKSSSIEYNSLLFAKQILSSYSSVKIDGHDYKICVPNVYFYQDNIIEMQYFKGENLELLLRDSSTHSKGVHYLNSILTFLINNGFNWIDFAPRNILINNTEICLIDFEKKLSSSIKDKKKYLQNHVYEEYASFIFESERLLSIDDVFSLGESDNNLISIDSIKIKRCKYLCEILYYNSPISILEYFAAWKMILNAELPFILDNDMIFPRLYLSKLLENKNLSNEPYYNYVNRIIEVNECLKPEEKIKVLKK